MHKSHIAMLLTLALAGCETLQKPVPPIAPLVPLEKKAGLPTASTDAALIKAATAHALKNGMAHWNNPATGNHGSVKTGKAVKVGNSLCIDIVSTTYSEGRGQAKTEQRCDPPVKIES